MKSKTDVLRRRRRLAHRHRRAAGLAILSVVLLVVIAYGKSFPLPGQYVVKAEVRTSNQLRPGGAVRIAGVKVGKVRGIEAGPTDTTVVTMEIEDTGRPVHSDATLRIKPRLVLEGNDYIDLDPGTPSAPELDSGETIPLDRTRTPVQLDQVLGTLGLAGRRDLHGAIAQLGRGLGAGAGERADDVTGAAGLRRAAQALDGALGSARVVARAARGLRPGDLPRSLNKSGELLAQVSDDPRALSDIVTHYNRVAGALARNDEALSESLVGIRDVLRVAPPTLRSLDASLPEVATFGDRLRPALQAAPTTLRKADRLLDQVRGLTRRPELPAALDELSPITRRLPGVLRRVEDLLPQLTLVNRCLTENVVPTLDKKIEDGPLSTGDPVWLEALHMGVTLAGGSPNFDGNGSTIRLGLSFGEAQVNGLLPGLGKVAGSGPKIQGVSPAWLGPGAKPPFHPEAVCADQPLPDLDKRNAPAPRWAKTGGNRP